MWSHEKELNTGYRAGSKWVPIPLLCGNSIPTRGKIPLPSLDKASITVTRSIIFSEPFSAFKSCALHSLEGMSSLVSKQPKD
jgi:hypothetical protein